MHHRCVRSRQRRRGSGEVMADIAKLSVGRGYYTRELATDHEAYLSGYGEVRSGGTAPAPGPWGWRRKSIRGRVPGHVRELRPTTGAPAAPTATQRRAWPPDMVLRPTKSVSILYGLGDPATGRAVLEAHHAGLAEAVGYLDEHLGAVVAMAVSGALSGRGCWRWGSITGHPGR